MLTGASSGVGRHLAAMLAANGAHVICCAQSLGELDTLVAQITAAGGKATAQACDVAAPASITAAFDAGERAAGTIDSVIANAGINHAGPAAKLSIATVDQIMTVNLRGAFLTAREGAQRMIASGPAQAERPRRIVFIASILGRRPQTGAAIYSVAPAGVLMLARSLALEWARHEINVNAILPACTPTDIVADWFVSDGGKAQMEVRPCRRLMAVEDLDPTVLFLLSPQSRVVSGTELTVDGTQTLA